MCISAITNNQLNCVRVLDIFERGTFGSQSFLEIIDFIFYFSRCIVYMILMEMISSYRLI